MIVGSTQIIYLTPASPLGAWLLYFFSQPRDTEKFLFSPLCVILGLSSEQNEKIYWRLSTDIRFEEEILLELYHYKNIFTYKLLYFWNHFTQVVVVQERLAWVCDLVSTLKPQLTQRTVVSPLSVPYVSRNFTISPSGCGNNWIRPGLLILLNKVYD